MTITSRSGGNRAVIIGAAHYDDPELHDHESIARSADAMAGWLDRSELWGPGSYGEVIRDPAAHADIMNPVRRAAEEVSPGGILLVVYAGHGWHRKVAKFEEVHFSLSTSEHEQMYSHLLAWHVYEAMRRSRAGLKVLIADCCHSDRLEVLGDPTPAAIDMVADPQDQRSHRSCVLTAVQPGSKNQADTRCEHLRGTAAGCTAYLGHLVQVLESGTDDPEDDLTLGQLARAVRQDIRACMRTHGTSHPTSNILPNGLGDDVPVFENRRPPADRQDAPAMPDAVPSPERWADRLEQADRASSIADAVMGILRAGPELTVPVLHEVERRGRTELVDKLIEGAVDTFDAAGRAQFMMLLDSQRVA